MVIVEKKHTDRVRICINPRPLNTALQRERYHLPTLDEVLPELSKAKVFAKCDLRSGYWHVPLDEASRKLTCFQTPFGQILWNRLPFGLKVSSEIFRSKSILQLETYLVSPALLMTSSFLVMVTSCNCIPA